jgi:hypothetical protein
MNLFGVDVRALDVEAFLAAARHAFPLLALAWLVLVVRLRRASVLLAGVLLANAYAWLETNWPLQRLYALGPSSDRVNNIALCQVVAAGHSPLYQPQVGTMHFEPFWAVLTAALSGWDTERLLRIYPLLPLVMACGFALSLFFALRPLAGAERRPDDPEPWSGWERALIALSATLLSSVPLDYAAPYRVPWAMTFLLKPNHSLGLVLLPWIVRGFAGIRRGRDRLIVGLLLHLLGWAFVIHMGAFCIGLVTFAVMAARWRRDEARRDGLDVAVVIGVNVLVVSPYLFMLFSGYGVFQHGPRLEIPPASPHLLEATARTAALFALAVWGVIVAWRRDRMGRVWAGQAVGAGLLWMSYYALHFLQQAKERDDTYYWLRVNLAVCAAIGAWNLAARLVPRLWPAKADAVWRAAILTALAIPFTLPYWWDPSRMDLYFSGSLPPLAEVVTSPAAYLRAHDAPRLVLAGDPTAVRWMAALTGARVLIARDFHAAPDHPAREQFNAELARGGPGDPAADGKRWGITHVVITPEFLSTYGVSLGDLDARPYLTRVHFAGSPTGEYVAVYALGAKSS